MEPGTELYAAHFLPGQKIDVTGTSVGKGFAGVMKRWNFKGGRATHGTSKAHRKGGSTGHCQDPGKVFKGKKMAGNMGNERVTVKNLEVYRVDVDQNLILVRGHVPGSKGGVIRVADAYTQPFPKDPPFPTITLEEMGEINIKDMQAAAAAKNPWIPSEIN